MIKCVNLKKKIRDVEICWGMQFGPFEILRALIINSTFRSLCYSRISHYSSFFNFRSVRKSRKFEIRYYSYLVIFLLVFFIHVYSLRALIVYWDTRAVAFFLHLHLLRRDLDFPDSRWFQMARQGFLYFSTCQRGDVKYLVLLYVCFVARFYFLIGVRGSIFLSIRLLIGTFVGDELSMGKLFHFYGFEWKICPESEFNFYNIHIPPANLDILSKRFIQFYSKLARISSKGRLILKMSEVGVIEMCSRFGVHRSISQ